MFINPFFTIVLLLLFEGCTNLGFVGKNSHHPQVNIVRSYFPNGKIEYEAEFINNKLDGTSRVWSEDGILLSVSEYSNGKAHGNWKRFHPNQQLKYEVTYFHGHQHGVEKWYYHNGQVKSKKEYEYGEPIKDIIRWNPNGSIIH